MVVKRYGANQEAMEKEAIESARHYFEKLTQPFDPDKPFADYSQPTQSIFDYSREGMPEHVQEAGFYASMIEDKLAHFEIGYETLDPAGVKSADQIRAEIQAALQRSYIAHARHYYGMQMQPGCVHDYSQSISDYLSSASLGYEMLDPSGAKTGDQLQAEIQLTVRTIYIGHARNYYLRLKDAANGGEYARGVIGKFHSDKKKVNAASRPDWAAWMVSNITKNLEYAGAGYQALDPNGNKSASDIRNEIDVLAKQCYVAAARLLFKFLCHQNIDPKQVGLRQDDILGIEDHDYHLMSALILKVPEYLERFLSEAGVGLEALDPSGEKNAPQLQAEIDAAWKHVNIALARQEYSAYMAYEGRTQYLSCIEKVRQYLHAAGVDAAALDPEGKKTVQDIDNEFDAAYIANSRKEALDTYERLQQEEGYRDNIFAYSGLLQCMQAGGIGFDALDPENPKRAAIMVCEGLVDIYFIQKSKTHGCCGPFADTILHGFMELSGIKLADLANVDPAGKTEEAFKLLADMQKIDAWKLTRIFQERARSA